MNASAAAKYARENPAAAEEAQQRLAEVLSRSSTDAEFRQALLSDSRAALSSHFGREIPETVNIAFVENRADATIVLPDPIDTTAELSEADLEAVAGGALPILAWVAIGFVVTAVGDAVL